MEAKKSNKWLTVGTMSLKKDTSKGKYSFLVKEDVVLKKGQYLNIQDPRETLKRLNELGHITESQLEERLAKIPDYIKFDFVLPPEKN